MRAEFHSGLQEIYLEHLDNNHDVAVWYAVNWVDWLADSRTPLQVHLDCRLKGNELGWMTRVKGPGRQFSILWDLVLAASRASVPPPSLPPSSPLFNFLSALCAPCPFAVPLPRIYFKFLLAAVTIHETFHLVNCHVFPDFGTPKTENLPHGEGGTAIEMQLFKGRIITEWYAGHEGDFSYLCGLYVLTSDGHVAITEEDLGVFMAELLDGRATKFSWKMVKRATYPTAEQGKVRTFAFKGKPIPKKTAWRQPVHRIFPGKVRKSMLEGCHD
ncbi:hypothetical protein FA95DRAFT_371413 [Auriscalpium vulgare]|uniref:Uncharacterized protein n=1 Tax=Auriscalpium vulgare TaxID=40419 RepID=A0ACB8RJ84_9AGAM|nr:hypothetical protein FA95DRAFT_371413 [Auriscalpium vulgare]